MDNLNTGILKCVPVLIPPGNEQRTVLEHIAQEVLRIDRDTVGALREIDLLREYRTRLIADVVTGKLDVRSAAAQLPEEVDNAEPFDEAEALNEADELMSTDEEIAEDPGAIREEAGA